MPQLIARLALAMLGTVVPISPDAHASTANAVRDIFRQQCVECHGPDLARPKGQFGYVLDLDRIASNREFVVPGNPDRSHLFALIVSQDPDDQMPPPNAKQSRRLTEAEAEQVRLWIATLDQPPESAALPFSQSADASDPAPIPWWAWLGRLHIVLVHFPVALILAAWLMDMMGWVRRNDLYRAMCRLTLFLGLTGLVLTTATGLIAGEYHGYSGELLRRHWNSGLLTLATGVILILASVASRRLAERSRRVIFSVALTLTAVLVGLTAHYGGLLVHGADYFSIKPN